MNFILGKKIRMTQIFTPEGKVIPVTEVSVLPNTVLRLKTIEKDGYSAIVLASGDKKKVKKSILGLFKNFGKFRYVKEFRINENFDLKPGDRIGITSFNEGEKVKVTSFSKGKGFQGPVKRHGFHGTDEKHGNKDQSRMPGSVGATGPAHIFKGTRMAGRMGGDRVTISNLEIAKIDLENNFLYLKGAVAGSNNSLLYIVGNGNIKMYEEVEITKEENSNDEVIDKTIETNTDKENISNETNSLEESEPTKENLQEKSDNIEILVEEKQEIAEDTKIKDVSAQEDAKTENK